MDIVGGLSRGNFAGNSTNFVSSEIWKRQKFPIPEHYSRFGM